MADKNVSTADVPDIKHLEHNGGTESPPVVSQMRTSLEKKDIPRRFRRRRRGL
jgi:hypothetical protein